MLYFAYGSNLDSKQMRARCPSAQFVDKALLRDHGLCFPRYGSTRGCGVASIEPADGHHVWGVVYDVADDDVSKMDECEGFDPSRPPDKNCYNHAQITVLREGNVATPITVFTYIAERQANPPLPNANYRDSIVCGARAWKLPDDYVKRLEAIKIS